MRVEWHAFLRRDFDLKALRGRSPVGFQALVWFLCTWGGGSYDHFGWVVG